ncbi:MAG TPA: C-type lectin domain-containing protein [Kofleriaceae bacterium]
MKLLVLVVATTACSYEYGWPSMPMSSDDADIVDGTATQSDASIDAFVAPPDVMVDAKVCPPAPSGCALFKCNASTSCYYLCGTSTSGQVGWATARNACANNGMGCIVTINNQTEQDCIAQRSQPVFPDNVWFGLRQSSSGSEPGGGWGWECGTSSYATPAWGTSEPNNQGGNEDCGILSTGGGWNDGDCDTESRFVCELP